MPSEWPRVRLREIAYTTSAVDRMRTAKRYVGLEHLQSGNPRIQSTADATEMLSSPILFEPGDVLFGKLRPYLRKVAVAEFAGCCTKEILVWRPHRKQDLDPGFLALILQSDPAIEHATATGAGSKMPRTSHKAMGELEVSLPPLPEQQRMVNLVRAVDDCVDAATTINEASERTLLQLRESLLSPAGNSESITLGDVIERVTLPVKVESESTYVEIGVRSHGRGTFLKEAVTGTALANKKVFNMTPGLLVFNIVFAWEGAVFILGEEAEGTVASHRFPTYRGKQAFALEILDHFFRTTRGRDVLQLASPGGAGRNKTLNQGALLRTRISLPPLSKWPVITEALAAAQWNVAATATHLNSLRELRAQLLAALLSGAHTIPETYDELMGA